MSEKQENKLRYVREKRSPVSDNVLRYVEKQATIQNRTRKDFGLRLIELMTRRGMSAEQLASLLGSDVATLGSELLHSRAAPGLAVVRALAYALTYPVSYFSPATDIDAATARDEEVYLDWLRMRQMELQEGSRDE